jgi:hypothetical protein
LKVRATNTQNWTLSPGTGLNQFSLKWGQTAAAGVPPVWNTISSTDSPITASLIPAADYKFDLKFQSPTQVEPPDLTSPQQTSLTVTADPAPLLPSSYVITGEWQVGVSSYVSMIGTDNQNNLWLLFLDLVNANEGVVKKMSPDGVVLNEFPVPGNCDKKSWDFPSGDGKANDIDSDGNIILVSLTKVCKLNTSGNLLGVYYTGASYDYGIGCTDCSTKYVSAGPNGYTYFAHDTNVKITMDPLRVPYSTIGYRTFGYPYAIGPDALQVTNESVYMVINGDIHEFDLEGNFKRVIPNAQLGGGGSAGTAKDPFGNLLMLCNDLTCIARLRGTEVEMLPAPGLNSVVDLGNQVAVDSVGKIYILGWQAGRVLILSPQY